MTTTEISELYVSIFNRASEKSGNDYWAGLTGHSEAAIANLMLATSDATTYFGSSLDTNQAFVEHIYSNTLNKTYTEDKDGIDYWVNLLDGVASRGDVVAGLNEAVASYSPTGENYDSTDTVTIASYNQFINRVAVSDNAATSVINVVTSSAATYADTMNFGPTGLNVTSDIATVTSASTALSTIAVDEANAFYAEALTTYNTAVTTAAASKTAAATAATTVDTSALASASLTAANTAQTDATAVVTAAAALVSAAAVTSSQTDDTTAAASKTSADSALTAATTVVSTATTAVSDIAASEAAATAATTTTTQALTTEIDNITGTSANDLFIGDAASTTTADQIDGAAGTDIFRLYDGAGVLDMPVLTNVEQIELVRQTASLDISANSTIELLTLDDSDNSLTYTVANDVSSVLRDMANGEAITIAYGATETIATTTVDALGTTAAVTANINGTGLTTINLKTSGTKSFVDLNSTGTITTLNISGATALDLASEASITTLDASDMTAGGLTVALAAPTTTIAFTGSVVDDIVTLGAALTSSDSLDAGTGTDVLSLASAAAATIAGDTTISSKISNFEILSISDDLVSSFDISKFGVNQLQLLDGSAGGGETISGFTSGATIELKDAVTMVDVLTVTVANATVTANSSDVLNIKANADIVAASFEYKLDVSGVETLNFEATDSVTSTGVITEGYVATVTSTANLTTLNVTGDREFSYITNADAVLLSTIDASASTAEVIIDASGVAGVAKTITGGTKDDTLTGSTVVDTINGGAGDDVIDGQGGNDIFIISSADESKGDTYDGAGNTDTLQIEATAVGTGGITQNLVDFTTPTNTILNNIDFTQAAAFANIENIDASAVTNSMKIIGVNNIANTITTGTGADIIDLNQDTDDANIINLTATNSVDGKEDHILDLVRGNDTLRITGDHGTNSMILNALTVTDNGDSAGNTYQFTDLGLVDLIVHSATVGTTEDLTDTVQLGNALTVNTTDEVTFTSNATTIVASAQADYIVGGSSAQTITLGTGNDVLWSTVSSTIDTITDFATGADSLILTGSNTAALDLGTVVTGALTAGYYDYTLGTTHVKLHFDAADMTGNVQLGTTSAAFSTTADIVAGTKNDVIQSGASNQSINLGAGTNVLFYNSASTDATGTGEIIIGGAGSDTILVAGGTTAVNFSDDFLGATADNNTDNLEILELTKTISGADDTNAQSLTMNILQLEMFNNINGSHNGTTGDTITLSEGIIVGNNDLLDAIVINGGLELNLANAANFITLAGDTTFDATTDSIKIDGSAAAAAALTIDLSLETTIGATIVGGAGADIITGTATADTFTGGSGIDTYNGYDNSAGLSVAATAETFTNAGVANGDTITFGNGVDTITDFVTNVDNINVTTPVAPTTMMNVAAGALADDTIYYLLGTYTNSVFTVNSAATSSTTNVAMLVVEGDGTLTETNTDDWLMLTGVSSLAAGDFV